MDEGTRHAAELARAMDAATKAQALNAKALAEMEILHGEIKRLRDLMNYAECMLSSKELETALNALPRGLIHRVRADLKFILRERLPGGPSVEDIDMLPEERAILKQFSVQTELEGSLFEKHGPRLPEVNT